MDIPTRIGLGSSALGTLAGLGAPIFGWWVSGPIMAVCAVVAGWGFWPLIRNAPLGFSRRIPLHIAARRAYEAAEKAGILHLTTSETASPEDKLFHFKLLFMVDDETELFGIKPHRLNLFGYRRPNCKDAISILQAEIAASSIT
jgi:hypothetical protein